MSVRMLRYTLIGSSWIAGFVAYMSLGLLLLETGVIKLHGFGLMDIVPAAFGIWAGCRAFEILERRYL